MKNVFHINAHETYEFSPGKLNASLTEKATAHFAAKGYEVRTTTMQDDYNIDEEIEKHQWADVILVMEDKHRARLRAQFRDEIRYKTLHTLDIPDLYRFMDPDLVEIIRAKAEPLIWGD